MKPLEFSYNEPSDILTVEGIPIDGAVFRAWAKKPTAGECVTYMGMPYDNGQVILTFRKCNCRESQIKKAVNRMKLIINRDNLMFAECTDTEEIISLAKEAVDILQSVEGRSEETS